MNMGMTVGHCCWRRLTSSAAVVRAVVADPEDPMSRRVVTPHLDVLLTELALKTRQIREREATR